MATLQKIRDKGTLLVVFVGVALVAFILGDLLTSGSTFRERGQNRAFVVDGTVVTATEFAERVNAMEDFQRMLSGQMLDEQAATQIREQVYQQMVRERLIGAQAARLGITVTRAELNDLVHGEVLSPILHQLPFFVDPNTGILNRDILMEFLSTLNSPMITEEELAIWLLIENMIVTQRLEEKYFSLLAHAVMINDVEVRNHFDHSQKNADIAFVMQHYFAIPDSEVEVTDREVREFFNRHRENFRFETPLVRISYFVYDITPSNDDFAAVEEDAARAAEELATSSNPQIVVADFSDTPFVDAFVSEHLLTPTQVEFVRSANIGDVEGPVLEGDVFQVFKLIDRIVAPDSVHLRMMGIPMMGFGQDSIVLNFVDSIYNDIRSGMAFADVANSLNPQAMGGDVGWAREIDLVGFGSDVVRQIFSAPVGQLLRLSSMGQELIVQIENRTRPVTKHKLAMINMSVIPSERTTNNVDNRLNQFVSQPDIDTRFNDLAAQEGFWIMPNVIVPTNEIGLSSGMMHIPGTRQVISWAANERRMGTVRRFDLPNMRVVAQVNEFIPAGIAPLSEMQSHIRMRLINERKGEHIISQLNAQQLTSLEAFADAMHSRIDTVRFVNFNTRNISGVGNEPTLNAVAGFAPVNSLQGPMAGNMGVYVAKVIDRAYGVAELDLELHRNIMFGEKVQRLQMQTVDVLRNKLGVTDYRYRFW